MKKVIGLFICSFFAVQAFAQFNPTIDTITFVPAPLPAGLHCGQVVQAKVDFGMTTLANAPLVNGDPVRITLCVTGLDWFSTNVNSVVTGPYASLFSWAFDSFAPSCIIGTQIATIPGNAISHINFRVKVPTTTPPATNLAIIGNLQVASYMNATNNGADDVGIASSVSYKVPLPLSLSEFNLRQKDCAAELKWTTLQESNSSHTNILRKSGPNSEFEVVGTVENKGESNETINYSFLDETVFDDSYPFEYKLAFIDFDNTSSFSEVRSLKMDCNPEATSFSLFPNPVDDKLSFTYTTKNKNEQVFVSLIDMSGKELVTKEFQIVESGTATFSFEVAFLPTGMYSVKFFNWEQAELGALNFLKR